jgi:hypothetical protein
LRRISVVVGLVVLMSMLAASAALADPPDGKGQPRAEETKEQGQPENPNGFGTVVSQKASTYHEVGKHSSSQGEPRQGLGNVARNDDPDDPEGDHPGDHGCFVGALDDTVGADPKGATDCSGEPGRQR